MLRPASSIRTKITLTFSAVFSVIFLAMSFYLYTRLKTIIVHSDNAKLRSRAETLLNKTELTPTLIPVPEKGEEIQVEYRYGQTRRLLYQSPGFPAKYQASSAGIIDTQDKRIAVVQKDLQEDIEEKLQLSLACSNSFLNEQLRLLLYLLIFANAISILLSAVLSHFLASYLLKPIQRIIQTAQQINQEGHMQTIPVGNTKDELQALTETLNTMFQRIEYTLKSQQHFFASAAHELRTPLSIMSTSLDVAMQKTNTGEHTKLFLQSQREEIDRLSRLVEDFLLVSQLKNPDLVLRKQYLSLDDLVLEVTDRFNQKIVQAGLRLELSFDEAFEHYKLEGDRDKIINVLINLFENAVKYATPGSTVCLSLTQKEQLLCLQIRNAIVRPIAGFEKLAQEFYQGDVLKDGYGIGLWISNKIVALHHGALQLQQDEHFFIARLSFPSA